jgi:hypothetical protein
LQDSENIAFTRVKPSVWIHQPGLGGGDAAKSNGRDLSKAEMHVKNYSRSCETPDSPRDGLVEPKGVALSGENLTPSGVEEEANDF